MYRPIYGHYVVLLSVFQNVASNPSKFVLFGVAYTQNNWLISKKASVSSVHPTNLHAWNRFIHFSAVSLGHTQYHPALMCDPVFCLYRGHFFA
jgi:hypothetical protein